MPETTFDYGDDPKIALELEIYDENDLRVGGARPLKTARHASLEEFAVAGVDIAAVIERVPLETVVRDWKLKLHDVARLYPDVYSRLRRSKWDRRGEPLFDEFLAKRGINEARGVRRNS